MAVQQVEKGMMAEMDGREAGKDSEAQQWRRCWQGTGRAIVSRPSVHRSSLLPTQATGNKSKAHLQRGGSVATGQVFAINGLPLETRHQPAELLPAPSTYKYRLVRDHPRRLNGAQQDCMLATMQCFLDASMSWVLQSIYDVCTLQYVCLMEFCQPQSCTCPRASRLAATRECH